MKSHRYSATSVINGGAVCGIEFRTLKAPSWGERGFQAADAGDAPRRKPAVSPSPRRRGLVKRRCLPRSKIRLERAEKLIGQTLKLENI